MSLFISAGMYVVYNQENLQLNENDQEKLYFTHTHTYSTKSIYKIWLTEWKIRFTPPHSVNVNSAKTQARVNNLLLLFYMVLCYSS